MELGVAGAPIQAFELINQDRAFYLVHLNRSAKG